MRMEYSTNIKDYLNAFNRLPTQSLSINAKIEEEDQVQLLLTSLPPLYDTLVNYIVGW